MAGLGQTNDSQALITGDPGSVYETEAQLRQYGDVLLEAGAGLRRIDTADGWRGGAADAFRKVYDNQPTRWLRAGDAFHSAADALGDYAATLGWAQDTAATAVGLWNAGDKQGATDVLASAQSQLAAAGDAAAAVVGRARDQAPPSPSIWDELTSDAGSFLSGAGHFLGTAGQDTVGALASLGNAGWHDPGALAELAGGLALATVSAGGEAGGVALDATGIGAILGVPVNVISAAGLTAGAGLSAAGLTTIVKDAAGPDRVSMMNAESGNGAAGTGSGEPPSNRIRPPQEGDTNYVVDNPNDLSDTVTDIDRIQDGTLWEEKTATGQDPRMNIQSWVQKNVAAKLDSYVRARQYLPGYEQAPLGLDFTQPGATSAFRAAVEQAVDQWKTTNPGVNVTVRWAP